MIRHGDAAMVRVDAGTPEFLAVQVGRREATTRGRKQQQQQPGNQPGGPSLAHSSSVCVWVGGCCAQEKFGLVESVDGSGQRVMAKHAGLAQSILSIFRLQNPVQMVTATRPPTHPPTDRWGLLG